MGAEQKLGSMENLGMRVPIGPTVVIASFISTRDDPKGEHPNIDLTAKNMAVWLTTPKTVKTRNEVKRIHEMSILYDFIIDADGIASGIAIRRNDGQIYFQTSDGLTKIEDVKKIKASTFLNLPEGASAQVITKEYPNRGLQESYTIITLPGGAIRLDIKEFFPFAGKRTLISGMKNRGLNFNLTGLWASRITDRSNLPFGRELPRKK